MSTILGRQQLSKVETTCGHLLNELQLIWDEMGETDDERDKMLLELEQECLEVYKRKVDNANRARASLHQLLAEMHSQIVSLASALGDRPAVPQLENRASSLKLQLAQLKPILEDMTRKKDERLRQIEDVRSQILRIQSEISPSSQALEASVQEQDLTIRRLEELQAQLHVLQQEKSDRLFKVVEYVDMIHELCVVLGLDFIMTIREVHPTLDESSTEQPKSISNDTIHRLGSTVHSLREEKKKRLQQIQELSATLLELWDLMDTPEEEQRVFQHVTSHVGAEEHEVVTPGVLSSDVIEQVGAEVSRLQLMKSSKMKELVLKKRSELEELCRQSHLIPDGCTFLDKSIATMDSGFVDPADILAKVEEEISNVKEEALSRKEIMDKIEKWRAACEEESWLEEYNKDENRYSATRGAHLNLKRAERARATVNKIPALVETLIAKTATWEEERGKSFLYDGVRLLSTIDEYNILRMEKEEEKRRQRDQKRLHEQLLTEQETLFGSKPSPNGRTPMRRCANSSRLHTSSTPASRRISLGGAMLHHESPALARYNTFATPRVEQRPVMESPAIGRFSGNTPARGGTSSHMPIKDTNHSRPKVQQAPLSTVNRVLLPVADDTLPISHGVLNAKTTSGSESDQQNVVNRMPLSPVPISGIWANANVESNNPSFTAVKSAAPVVKSPISKTQLSRSELTEANAENTTPQKPASVMYPPSTTPQPQQQTPVVSQSPVTPQVQKTEYSFEERRLAYMYHYHPSH